MSMQSRHFKSLISCFLNIQTFFSLWAEISFPAPPPPRDLKENLHFILSSFQDKHFLPSVRLTRLCDGGPPSLS